MRGESGVLEWLERSRGVMMSRRSSSQWYREESGISSCGYSRKDAISSEDGLLQLLLKVTFKSSGQMYEGADV
jgi:hypothetical protein